MNCPLCDLIKRIKKYNISKKKWNKKIGKLNIKGEIYICNPKYAKSWKDIVRYVDDKFLFVKNIKNIDRNRDGVVCMTLKHIDKKNIRKPENAKLLQEFDAKIIEFIKKNYKNVNETVRVIEHFGELASIKNHFHKQIWYTKSKGIHFKYKSTKYD